jgi:hypothetical protein
VIARVRVRASPQNKTAQAQTGQTARQNPALPHYYVVVPGLERDGELQLQG